MTERHPLDAPILATVHLIDVAEHARALYGDSADLIAGRRLPAHDFRFEITTEERARVSFGQNATATEIGAWLERERSQHLTT